MSSYHRPWGTLDPERTVSVPWLFGSMLITGPTSHGGEETLAVRPNTCFQPPVTIGVIP